MQSSLTLQTTGRLVTSLVDHHHLIWQLTKRQVTARYRGSYAGLLWALLFPLLMLGIYTYVFGVLLKVRFAPGEAEGAGIGAFAIFLFAGLILHQFMAECMNQATGLIIGHGSYVKKIVFPLEALGWMVLGTAGFHLLTGFMILLGAVLWTQGGLPWTVIYLPLVIAPFLILNIGIAWLLSALGVFLRDIGQIIAIVPTLLMFLSPIPFPMSSFPESVRNWVFLNPLTLITEQVRAVVLHGQNPDWAGLTIYALVAVAVAWFGLYVFLRSKQAFADVL